MLTFVKGSVASNNPESARGGGAGETVEEIRQNAMANFSAQQRTVTKEDYIFRALAMPPQFGKVANSADIPIPTEDSNILPIQQGILASLAKL